MNKLIVVGRKLLFDRKNILVDDLYTPDFYTYSQHFVDDFYNETYAVNEVYDNIYQDYLALKKILNENSFDVIDLRHANQDICFYLADLAHQRGIKITNSYLLLRKTSNIIEYSLTKFVSLGYFLYLMAYIRYTGEKIDSHSQFSVIRAKSSAGKIKRFTNIHKEFEYPFNKHTIYRLFTLRKKWGWVFKAYYRSFYVMKDLKKFYKLRSGKWSILALNNFYKKRIVHAEIYKLMLDEYFSYFQGCEFYTGNNLCRFSVIEDQLALKHGLRTFNIPHGIEYGFKYPKGFSSEIFYANTQYTANWLNKLYNTDKYVFDVKVTEKMFKLDISEYHEMRVVYFSEPREVEVNLKIVSQLIPLLKSKGIKLYLKLHPGDVKSNYDSLEATQIVDYTEAMVGNICIARKSTCLLEAIYNNSIPIAIITNQKDQTIFDLFPSLNSEKIVKTHDINELYYSILKYYKT